MSEKLYRTNPIPRSIGAFNQKGGVLKTAITKNLADNVAQGVPRSRVVHDGDPTRAQMLYNVLVQGANPVLIVDCDAQGDQDLEWGVQTDNGESLARSLLDPEMKPQVQTVRSETESSGRIDLIAGGPALEQFVDRLLDPHFTNDEAVSESAVIQRFPIGALAKAVAPLAESYAVTIVDTSPGCRVFRRLTLAATNYAIFPTKSDAASRRGVQAFMRDAVSYGAVGFRTLGAHIGPTRAGATRIFNQTATAFETEVRGKLRVFETSIPEVSKGAFLSRELGLTAREACGPGLLKAAIAKHKDDTGRRLDLSSPIPESLYLAYQELSREVLREFSDEVMGREETNE